MSTVTDNHFEIHFRANFGSGLGIGHLSRCCWIAGALRRYGYNSILWVDNVTEDLASMFPESEFRAVYTDGYFIDEKTDAIKFAKLICNHPVKLIFVDDYRLTEKWEGFFRNKNISVAVIDDTDIKRHDCDVLIDPKYTGSSTATRYDGKVPTNCMRLLGPEYLPLSPSFSEIANDLSSKASGDHIQIPINIGGGGDWDKYKVFLTDLVEFAYEHGNVLIRPIIGPLSSNSDFITDLNKKYRNIDPVVKPKGLFETLTHADLFITAAGTSLFEAICLRVPTLSFQISSNQSNDVLHMEDLGHYFPLSDFEKYQPSDLVDLCRAIVMNISRIKQLYQTKTNTLIDGHGVCRITKVLSQVVNGSKEQLEANELKLLRSCHETARSWSPIGDEYLNRYLHYRNLPSNLKNMTEHEPIDALDHYIWWFTKNDRKSFVVKRGEVDELIFWHRKVSYSGSSYIIGGWFACSAHASIGPAFFGLEKQLMMNDAQCPELGWLAVIHKNNKFVQKMNERFGFKKIENEMDLIEATSHFFPNASREEFWFYAREPKSMTV